MFLLRILTMKRQLELLDQQLDKLKKLAGRKV